MARAYSLVTKLQAAVFLGVDEATIDRFVAEGQLHIVRQGQDNQLSFFSALELVKLKAQLEADARNRDHQPDLESVINTFELVVKILGRIRPDAPSRGAYKGAFTTEGASGVSGISAATIRRDINSGNLKAKKIDGVWRIKRTDFYDYYRKVWGK